MNRGKRKRSVLEPEGYNFEEALESSSDQNESLSNRTEINCPNEDLLKLAERVQQNLPENDHLAYMTRLERINWDKIAFGEYSGEKCKQMWILLQRRVRKFRLMREIVSEVKEFIEKSEKNSRHPDMPKQPPNSYLLFALENRAAVTQQFSKWGPNDIARKLGNLFKQLPPDQKQKYDERAIIARKEYAEKLQDFYASHPECAIRKKSKSDIEEAPKKPRSPFEIFFQSEVKKEGFENRDECRERWKQMVDEEKLFWINWAEEEHCKYMEDVKTYMKNHPKFTPLAVQGLSRKDQAVKDRLAGKPVKPPRTAFQLFTKMMSCQETLKNTPQPDGIVKGMGGAEAMVLFSKQWQNCTQEEKDSYKTRLNQLWDQYTKDVTNYVEALPPHERDNFLQNSGITKSLKVSKKTTAQVNVIDKEHPLKQPKRLPISLLDYFATVYKGTGDAESAWNQLSSEEKLTYKDDFAQKKMNYLKEYDKYLRSLTNEELEKLARSTANTSDIINESDSDC